MAAEAPEAIAAEHAGTAKKAAPKKAVPKQQQKAASPSPAPQERARDRSEDPESKPASEPTGYSKGKVYGLPSGGNGLAGHRIIASSWLAGIVVISWQEVKVNQRAPDPSRFVGWSAALGILDLLSVLISAELGAVFAVGLLLGLMIFRKPTASALPGTGEGSSSSGSASGSATGSGSISGSLTPAAAAEAQGLTNPSAGAGSATVAGNDATTNGLSSSSPSVGGLLGNAGGFLGL